MKTINGYLLLIICIMASSSEVLAQGIIYKHDFGTVNITTHPYTAAPAIMNANLLSTSSSWTNSTSAWTSGTGVTGRSLVLANSQGTPTVTLTFNVAAGYAVSVTSYNFWRERGNSGATQWNMTINGSTAGSGTIPQAPGSYIGNKAIVGDGFWNLTGTVTVVFTLTGSSGPGSAAFSLDDFTLYGIVTNITAGTQGRLFRTRSSGNWGDVNIWESAPTGNPTNFTAATAIPSNVAYSITIRNGHTVTTDIVASSKWLIVEAGATLIQNSPLYIVQNNSAVPTFDMKGTLILNGTVPDIRANNNSITNRMAVDGLVRVDAGGSEALATNPRVMFNAGSIFQWNTTDIPETAQTGLMTYFPNATGLIFRMSVNLDGIGVTGPGITQFNAKVEIDAGVTVKFIRNGDKIFRDGLGGAGTIIHQSLNGGASSNCGPFKIGVSGSPAVIDGTLNIIIQQTTTNDIDMAGDVTITGSPTITVGQQFFGFPDNATFTISGNLLNNGANPIDLTNGSLTFSGNGRLSNSSTNTFLPGAAVTGIKVISTVNNSAIGILRFTPGFNTVYSITMGDPSAPTSTTARIVLGHDINVEGNINLYQGIIVTEDKLLTWNNTSGVINLPSTYTNSFIATCTQSGMPLSITGVDPLTTSPFTGNAGFRVKNVRGFFYTRFVVAPDFSRPNKMELNPGNNTPTDITVVVGKGDILYTPQPRVNRIWYVHASNQANVNQSGIRLYFTKFNWSSSPFMSGQDEIEDGFISSQVYVGRKDYLATNFLNNRSLTPRDIGGLDGTEGYAEYVLNTGIGSSVPGYYKFSAGNFATIILPVTIDNLKAYKQDNNVVVSWSSLNETNVAQYEVQRSSNAVNFAAIATVKALNNNKPVNEYIVKDVTPLQGKNFYRIKITDKDGQVSYSQVVSLDISDSKVYIAIVPNPVQNKQMNIQLYNIQSGRYDVLLYSLTGQLLCKKKIDHIGGSAIQNIILPSLIANGTYVICVQNSLVNYKYKVVIE